MTASGIPVTSTCSARRSAAHTDVSTDQDDEFIFRTGRAWAQALGYPESELSRVPDAAVENFAGVANTGRCGGSSPARSYSTPAAAPGRIRIRQGDPVATYARSAFEDTRRKAAKFGAMGSTIRPPKPVG
jgi:hypothetical protein